MCASHKQAVEDILPSFSLVIALESLTAEQQKYLQVIVAICSLAFDGKVLQCLSQCVSLPHTCLLTRLLLWHETFRGSSSENLRSRIRVKTWIYQMIPPILSHSYLPPTQENDLMPLCLASARISWQSGLSVQTVMPSNVLLLALETLTQGGEILLLSLETFSVQSYGMMADSQQRIAGRQSWDSVGLPGWKQHV